MAQQNPKDWKTYDQFAAGIATNRLACRLCVEHAGMPAGRVLYAPYGVDVDGLGMILGGGGLRKGEGGRDGGNGMDQVHGFSLC